MGIKEKIDNYLNESRMDKNNTIDFTKKDIVKARRYIEDLIIWMKGDEEKYKDSIYIKYEADDPEDWENELDDMIPDRIEYSEAGQGKRAKMDVFDIKLSKPEKTKKKDFYKIDFSVKQTG